VKRRLFGWHPAKTAEYLRRHRQLQSEERIKLEQEISAQEEANAKLRREVERLEAEAAALRSKDERLELAFERLEDSKKALSELGRLEAEAIRQLTAAREAEHRQQVDRIEAQSRSYEETFRALISELSELMRQVDALDASFSAADPGTKSAPFAEVAAAAARNGQRAEEQVDAATENDPLQLVGNELAALQNRANVIQFKLRNIVEREEAKPQPLIESRTVEGAQPAEASHAAVIESAPPLEATAGTTHALAEASSWGSSATRAPRKLIRKREARRPVPHSEFWGDIHDYMQPSVDYEEYLVAAEPDDDAPSEFFDAPDARRSFDVRAEPGAAESPTAALPAPTTAEDDGAISTAPASGADARRTPGESPALSEEIVAIRNRYIVGKLAGEPLYGHDGRLIIDKHQTITAKVVQEADREGKLPDLIVHMIIPSLSEDDSK